MSINKEYILPNDKMQVEYNEKGDSFQNLIAKAFQIHMKTGSYSLDKGDKDNG